MLDIMKKRADKIKKAIALAIEINVWKVTEDGEREITAVSMDTGTENDGDYTFNIEINEEGAIVTTTAFFLKGIEYVSDELTMLLSDFNNYTRVGSFIISRGMIGFRSDFSYHDSLISPWAISELLSNMEYCMDNADDLVEKFILGKYSYHYCEEEYARRLEDYFEGCYIDKEMADKQYQRMHRGIERSGYEIRRDDSGARMCNIIYCNGIVALEIYYIIDDEMNSIRLNCQISAEFDEKSQINGARASFLISNLLDVGTCELQDDRLAIKIDIPYYDSIISADLIGYMLDEAIESCEKYGSLIYKLADGELTYGEFAIKVLKEI